MFKTVSPYGLTLASCTYTCTPHAVDSAVIMIVYTYIYIYRYSVDEIDLGLWPLEEGFRILVGRRVYLKPQNWLLFVKHGDRHPHVGDDRGTLPTRAPQLVQVGYKLRLRFWGLGLRVGGLRR